jgi:hypothetical protein
MRPKFYERKNTLAALGTTRIATASIRDTVIFGMSRTTVEQKSLRIVKRKKSRSSERATATECSFSAAS